MLYLKADTAVRVLVGPAVAVGDGYVPVTNLTLSGADEAELIKYNGNTALAVTDINGATFSAIASADGYYDLSLTAAHTDTEGFLVLLINDDSLILPIRHEFMVVNANVYDSLFAVAATDYLQVDTIQISGTSQTANDVGQDVNDILTDTADMQPKLGTPVTDISADIATVDSNVDAILSDTGTDGVLISMAQSLPGSPTADTVGDALKQSTYEVAIKKNATFDNFEFLMVDSTDGKTAKTGLSVTGERSIDGGAFASVTGTIAEVSDGIYQFDAAAADTNGDVVTWRFSGTGALDAFFTFKTVT